MVKKKTPIEILQDGATAKRKEQKFLSLGCPLLNLAVSGDWQKGIMAGTYVFYVGDSSSGKTLATLTLLAEAANNPDFDDYELWHIDAEVGNHFDFERFFGRKAAARIMVKRPAPGKPMLLEEVYDWLEAKIKANIKFVAIIDSMDTLSSEQKEKQIAEDAKNRAEGKDIDGNYGDGKAKINSQRLPRILTMIEDSGSILLSISQVRDNLKAGLYGPKHVRGGGHAIKFGGSVEIWTYPGESMLKEVNGTKRNIGMIPIFKVEKNRVNGRKRVVKIPIMPDFGMDATGAAVDFLLAEKAWSASSGRITCPFYETTHYREELIRKIEDDGREQELFTAMQECWDSIEAQLTVTRKKRYE
jgi:RecA/RadA recombinase